jgi:GNAT superfamily N-acetyltransferase
MSRIGSERPSRASAFKKLSRKVDMRYALKIRPLSPADRDWVKRHIAEHWGAEIVVAHGTIYHPAALPGFVAELDGKMTGLVTFQINGDACEIVTLDSLHPGRGIGTALIEEVKAAAGAAGCRRLWLITTNDNLHALGFYQKRGFRLVAVHPGAVDAARKLKPEIPLIGNDGIPIRDEIELEIVLT